MEDRIKEYLCTLKEEGKSEDTVSNYKYRLLDFLRFYNSRNKEDIVSVAQKYAKHLLQKKSPLSAYSYFSTIVHFLDRYFLKDHEDKEGVHKALKSLYTLSKERSVNMGMGEKERKKLYGYLKYMLEKKDFLSTRDALIALLFEALGLHLKDIMKVKLSNLQLLDIPKCGKKCVCYEKNDRLHCSDSELLRRAVKEFKKYVTDDDSITVSKKGKKLSRIRLSQILAKISKAAGLERAIRPRDKIFFLSRKAF